MDLKTFGELNQKIRADIDMVEEDFVTPDEMVGYFNDAVHEAESEILKINEDYFLTSATLSFTSGISLYSLPAGIYAQKIRGLQYVNGSVQYTIPRIRGSMKFAEITDIQINQTFADYQYILKNDTVGAQSKLMLVPPARETGAFTTIWYIRSAATIPTAADQGILPTDPNDAVQLATVIDIPEFYTFIIDFVKCRCLSKDGGPQFDSQVSAMESQRKQMVDSLTQQVPDDDDTVVQDMSFYADHS